MICVHVYQYDQMLISLTLIVSVFLLSLSSPSNQLTFGKVRGRHVVVIIKIYVWVRRGDFFVDCSINLVWSL